MATIPLTDSLRQWLEQGAESPDGMLPQRPVFLRQTSVARVRKAGYIESVGLVIVEGERPWMRYRITESGRAWIRGDEFF